MRISATMAKYPDWCQLFNDYHEGHSGPIWPKIETNRPRFDIGGFSGVSISVGSDETDSMIVFLEAPNAQLTGEQALAAGRQLIEAGEWALAHSVE